MQQPGACHDCDTPRRYEPAELARLITHGGIAGIANGPALMKHRLRRYAGREQLPDEQT